MNCTCGVEIAAQSAIGGRCARCAAKLFVPLPPEPTPGVKPPPPGAVPMSSYQDTTLAPLEIVPGGVELYRGVPGEAPVSYDDVKKAYEEEIGPVPTVRKKGK